MELQLDDGLRSSLSIRPGFGRYSGISSKFAKRFTEGIEKLAGNMSGDCRKKTIGLTTRTPEAVGLAGMDKTSCCERKKPRSSKDKMHNQEVENLALIVIDDEASDSLSISFS
ncbi:hypothetical protein GW17_00042513 [Ensete ventricosum]|nr:hypothetical protein GW17_00042513 [Ensete ventricosum]